MKYIIPSINTDEIQHVLSKIKAKCIEEEDIFMEYFDLRHGASHIWVASQIPDDFHKLFHFLKIHIKKGSLESHGYYLTLIEKNETCFLVLHQIHPKKSNKLEAVFTIQFHLYEWANVEEMLLEHGFEMICHIEEKRSIYRTKAFDRTYILVIPPSAPAHLEVTAQTEDDMVKALAEIGYSMDQAIQVEG